VSARGGKLRTGDFWIQSRPQPAAISAARDIPVPGLAATGTDFASAAELQWATLPGAVFAPAKLAVHALNGPCLPRTFKCRAFNWSSPRQGRFAWRQENLDVEVHFSDGTLQIAQNVNKSANWRNLSFQRVNIPLKVGSSVDQRDSFSAQRAETSRMVTRLKLRFRQLALLFTFEQSEVFV